MRGLQMGAVPLAIFVLDFDLPAPLTWAHFGITVLVGVLDVIDVVLQHLRSDGGGQQKEEESDSSASDEDEEHVPTVKVGKNLDANAAFNLEPVRRKRFVFSVANRTRWPLKPRLTGIRKKTQ